MKKTQYLLILLFNVTAVIAAAQTKYEAENAALTGVNIGSSNGITYVSGLDTNGDKIIFTVSAPSAGSYPLVIRYQNSCGTCQKYQGVKINSGPVVDTRFLPASAGWNNLNYGNVTLSGGNNTITISKSWGWTDIDYITVGTGTTTTYTLNVTASNGTVTKNPNQAAYNEGSTVTLTAIPNNGYTFSGWSGSASGSANPLVVTMNGNKNITANFTSAPTTIVVNNNTIGTGSLQFNYDPGWNLATGSSAYSGDEHWTNSTNATYTFQFTGTQIKVYGTKDAHHGIAAFSIDGGAEVNVDFYSSTRVQQALIWSSPGLSAAVHTLSVRCTGTKNAGSAGYVIVADKNEVTTASVSNYSLNVTATNGSIAKNPNQTSYASGTNVVLTANPNSGYTFSNWSGDASGNTNPITITMNSSKNITANFTPVTASTLVDPRATQETINLWNYMNSIYGQKVLTGIWEKSGLDNIQSHSAKVAAILGQDMNGWHPRGSTNWNAAMQEQRNNLINHYNNGGIIQVNWHWENPFDYSKSAWSDITASQWNNLVIPGTAEYNTIIADIDLHVNNYLKLLVDNNGKRIPVLFRPLHEIDGGWFWWTNEADPAKTVTLYKIIFDRIKNYHGLHNLIWVWNNGENASSAASSGAFYPGNNYADIVSTDIYHIDYQNTGLRYGTNSYKFFWDMLGQIAPGKPRALGECDALPNGDKTQNGDPNFVKWMYALAWWAPSDGNGTGLCQTSPCNPSAWANTTYNHNVYLTKDEIQTNGAATQSLALEYIQVSAVESTVEEDDDNINVYPNPLRNNNNNLTIDLKGFQEQEIVTISILKMEGESVFTQQIIVNEQGIGTVRIYESKINPGIYIIKARSRFKSFLKRMVVL